MKLKLSEKLKKSDKTSKVLLGVLLLVICSMVGIFAYFLDADEAENKLTVGSNVIEIVEEFDPPEELEPSVEFTKDVKVKNTGLSDCYVRIKAVFDNNHMEQYCEIDWNDTDWVYNSSDGYWYYPTAIKKDKSTPSLMTTVKIKDNAPEHAMKDFDIIIYAESIESRQAVGFENYVQAWANYQKNQYN